MLDLYYTLSFPGVTILNDGFSLLTLGVLRFKYSTQTRIRNGISLLWELQVADTYLLVCGSVAYLRISMSSFRLVCSVISTYNVSLLSHFLTSSCQYGTKCKTGLLLVSACTL